MYMFERFELNAQMIGHVLEQYFSEIRLTGLRAEAGEFGYPDTDGIIPAFARVGKGFQVLLGRVVMVRSALRFQAPILYTTWPGQAI